MSYPKITYSPDFRRRSATLKGLLLCLLLACHASVFAQHKRWYFFEEAFSQDDASKILDASELEPVIWSNWFHAWSANGNGPGHILGVDSTRSVTPLQILSSGYGSPSLGFALEQIGAEAIVQDGLTGKGVKIGIIDGGFLGADKSETLSSVFLAGNLKGYRDYLGPAGQASFGGSRSLDDQHGTEVWELTGGFHQRKQIQFGLATGASYYLARTDHGAREQRQEEDFLIAALEWMDSLNVKLVNISLGYNTDFDNPSEDYTPGMMDGKTSLASLACQKATEEKGMLIVVAAGNDGNNKWRIIDVPADPPGVLTVGSTDLKYWRKMSFSSIGTEFTPFLKPDISCFASSGTSFSAPVITGLAACLWEKAPSLTNADLKALILQSGHLAGAPNNYLGYGVPSAKWLIEKLQAETPATLVYGVRSPTSARKKIDIVLEGEGKKQVVLFHKKDSLHVIKEEFSTQTSNQLAVRQLEGAKFTTVVVDHLWVMEVEWE